MIPQSTVVGDHSCSSIDADRYSIDAPVIPILMFPPTLPELTFIRIERLLLMRHALALILGALLLAATVVGQRTTVLSYLAEL